MSALPSPASDIPREVLDARIAELIHGYDCCPEELLCMVVDDFEPKWIRAARNLVYMQFRHTLSDAIANGTPANFEAVGRVAVDLLRAAWTEQAEDVIRRKV